MRRSASTVHRVSLAALWAAASMSTPACDDTAPAAPDGSSVVPGVDGGPTTSPQPDAAVPVDAQTEASTTPEGGAGCVPFQMPADCSVPEGAVLPGELRCTGLYGDWPARELACDVMQYAPAYALWSDGATKQRYAWLPPGTSVDASDPDSFVYPVGTRFWKEFWVGDPGTQRLGETRLLEKGELGWLYTSYVWTEDGTQAIQQNDGVQDLFGTGHEVPTRDDCRTCHGGRADFVLGWDLPMLGPGATGMTSELLVEAGLLTGLDPNASTTIPGDAVEEAALGYLHANCGVSCHNESTFAEAKSSGLFLRLEHGDLGSVHTTDAVTSGVNQPPGPNAEINGLPLSPEQYLDFRPLDAERSLVVARMDFRGSPTAMPPLGTHDVDPEGLQAVRAWIAAMTEARGYPAPVP